MPPRTIRLGDEPAAEADVIRRLAVRAITQREDRLLLLRATATGGYKFPGGGVEPGEHPEDALRRELDEECGRSLLTLGELDFVVVESRPATDRPGAVFRMESRYYRCEVGEAERSPRLEEYEQSLGLTQDWVTPQEAIDEATRVIAGGTAPAWAVREREVLRLL
jgi:8-oxo-dGTP diphosphatase